MATIELCDLCGGKVKETVSHVSFSGTIRLRDGKLPELPTGMKYKEQESSGERFVKVWNSFGKVISETTFVDKPPSKKDIRISYDLCETCLQKFIEMFEAIRKNYHLESKEIEFLGDTQRDGFLDLLGFKDSNDET